MLRSEYEDFDATPTDEDCTQVGPDTTRETFRPEIRRMMELLDIKFPNLPGRFNVRWNSHDFGEYPSIRYTFWEDDEGYASLSHVEDNWPQTWQDTEPAPFTYTPDPDPDLATV